MTDRLTDGATAVLQRRTSRRGVLSRAALVASALTVAPLRYLLRPGTAWAAISPDDCSSGLCTDGWTAFCCEINKGRNVCPSDTYVAGWWKCTAYRGGGLCDPEGVRYYLDCNRIPGHDFHGGCQCAKGSCRNRMVDCAHFRYGQCNTQVNGTTEVACRLVVCENPSHIEHFNCNKTWKSDDLTCEQEARCLDRPEQRPGAGGA